jgi:hypothetical protein
LKNEKTSKAREKEIQERERKGERERERERERIYDKNEALRMLLEQFTFFQMYKRRRK